MARTTLQRFAEQKVGPLGPYFVRCKQEGVTDAAIAEALDIPLSTVKNWKRELIEVEQTIRLREPASA